MNTVVAKLRGTVEIVDRGVPTKTADVGHHRSRLLHEPPPRSLEADAQIHILEVHEEAGVESSDLVESAGSNQDAGRGVPAAAGQTPDASRQGSVDPGAILETIPQTL